MLFHFVVYGVLCVECEVWCAMCGVWCAVCDVIWSSCGLVTTDKSLSTIVLLIYSASRYLLIRFINGYIHKLSLQKQVILVV